MTIADKFDQCFSSRDDVNGSRDHDDDNGSSSRDDDNGSSDL